MQTFIVRDMVRGRGPAALRAGFATAALSWLVLILLAPAASASVNDEPAASWMRLGVYAVGALICHQQPGRSFFIGGAQMPVCARCTGLYAGAAAGCLFVALRGRRRAPGPRKVRLLLALAALPVAVTLAYEWSSGVTPGNLVRAVSAVPLGLAVAWTLARVGTSQGSVELH